MKIKGKDFPQFKETEWLADFSFAVDVFEDMNELNTIFLGKGCYAHKMCSIKKAFRVKFKLFSWQISQNNRKQVATTEQPMMSMEKYTSMIFTLGNKFRPCFADFQKLGAEFDIVSSSFATDFEKYLMLYSWNWLICSVTLPSQEKLFTESMDKLSAL